jgi:hypothetical protein
MLEIACIFECGGATWLGEEGLLLNGFEIRPTSGRLAYSFPTLPPFAALAVVGC